MPQGSQLMYGPCIFINKSVEILFFDSSSHGWCSCSRAVPGCQPCICKAVLWHKSEAQSNLRAAGQQPETCVGHQHLPWSDQGGREWDSFWPGTGHTGQLADWALNLQTHETPQLHNEGGSYEPLHVSPEEWRGWACYKVTETIITVNISILSCHTLLNFSHSEVDASWFCEAWESEKHILKITKLWTKSDSKFPDQFHLAETVPTQKFEVHLALDDYISRHLINFFTCGLYVDVLLDLGFLENLAQQHTNVCHNFK